MKSPLLTFALLCFFLSLNGQIQKNTWLIGGEMRFQRTTIQDGAIQFDQYEIAPEFLFFPLSKFGFGGRFTLLGSYSNNDFGPTSFNSSFFNVEIAPKLRYIFYQWTEGQTNLFMEGGAKFGLRSQLIDFAGNERETFEHWGWFLGPGISHFLSPDVVLEWQMFYQNTDFIDNKQTPVDEGEREIGLAALIRLRFFLNDKTQEEANAMNSFEKGNWMIGGIANFNYDEELGYNLAFSPRVGNFLAKRFVLGFGPDIVFFDRIDTEVFSWGLESFARYYQPISPSLQFFPAISFRYGRIKNKDTLFSATDVRIQTSRFKIGGGLNTLIQPNVGLEFLLSYQRDNIKQVKPEGIPTNLQDNLLLEIGFQFFLTKFSE